ncbi:MAG TPA: amylo-alpha-1,6-glucosidase [Planctomycetota bacterium]|nr:amylo-alpha-1,6-glucosidase [Planctomycetota bacterium]
MDDLSSDPGQHYIVAASARLNDRVRVLKHGDSFAVFDSKGDILPIGHGEQGIYHEGTRYLSRLEFRLQDRQPFLLSSTVKEQVAVLSVNLTNPDISTGDHVTLRRNSLHVTRSSLLWEMACHEDLRIRNYERDPVDLRISIAFDADFADIFEVRGFQRRRRGRLLDPVVDRDGIVIAYDGLDGIQRRLRVRYSPEECTVEPRRIRFEKTLPPRGEESIHVTFSFEQDALRRPRPTFRQALGRSRDEIEGARASETKIHSTNANFNQWISRSTMDLHMMFTKTPAGIYPYAGVPWFSCVFGRDGILTALQYLWINPEPARGVLRYLAQTQATEVVPDQDAEPGKILHEARKGELAALGEIPFGKYYGSVDATPLFVILAGAYFERTGDRATVDALWPHVRRALEWIDRYGDPDGDGFVEYSRTSTRGLANQGWKDSHDAIFHADGSLAEGPIALCEVQAYVYGARLQGATLADEVGERDLALELRRKAELLRTRFVESFWDEELGIFGLALDGRKRLCRVRTSNAGHALFTGIADPGRAARVAGLLLEEAFFTGWGVRTVASTEARYNPLSYHNGSVWPHDNAILALGMSRYDLPKAVLLKLFTGLFGASISTDFHRLPELYCGLRRLPGEGPTLYPVACSPQSWASGAAFMMIQASLGLSLEAARRRISFHRPALPEWLSALNLRGLQVGNGRVDIDIARHERDVAVTVVGRKGDVEVLVTK